MLNLSASQKPSDADRSEYAIYLCTFQVTIGWKRCDSYNREAVKLISWQTTNDKDIVQEVFTVSSTLIQSNCSCEYV